VFDVVVIIRYVILTFFHSSIILRSLSYMVAEVAKLWLVGKI
jgi:hypothetical protein